MSDKVLFLISRSYYFILQTFKKIKKHFFSSVNPLYTLSKCDCWGHQSKDSEWFYLAGILDWSAFIPTSFSIWARYTTEGSDWYKQDLCHIKPKEKEATSADSEQPGSFSTVSLNLERKKERKKPGMGTIPLLFLFCTHWVASPALLWKCLTYKYLTSTLSVTVLETHWAWHHVLVWSSWLEKREAAL